ncbi:hypothetical protein Clacol_004755 [Clathrus columnatus]|uniref:Acetyl-CoA synthetase-like protein n=1 Tax=Clathrus columnatus TaxID=1419009 RepID=A0AAV5A7D5_9AGAM|nr:hypothetical protein Clacol_004755 [Clathrus columnatus]
MVGDQDFSHMRIINRLVHKQSCGMKFTRLLASTGRTFLTLSYVEGSRDPPLSRLTLDQYFQTEILNKFGDRPALICPDEQLRPYGGPESLNFRDRYLAWNFNELDRHISALSRGLVSLGVRKGDRVAVIMGNNSAYAILQWACARIGAVLVTMNPAYRANEFVSALQLVEASTLFIVPGLRNSNYISLLSSVIPSISSSSPANISSEALPYLRSLVVVNNSGKKGAFKELLKPVKSAIDFRELFIWSTSVQDTYIKEVAKTMAHDETINLQFTSGTTGAPKAVSVPTHFLGILDEISKRGNIKLPKLRTGIAAGSSIPEDLMRQLIDKLNLTQLTIAYGMTETSPVSFQTIPEDPLVKRIETVGRVQPHVKAKIIDTEGNVVPVNTPGELCVAGYLVQKGYWNAPAQTASVMKRHPGSDVYVDLWMHTGDEAMMDKEGYLRIISRIKDIIIRAGENLFPVQIENVITTHPSIREAAVIAVPDPIYGEVVGAWVVRNMQEIPVTRIELRKWVGRHMNPQNQPSWLWFVGEDNVEKELPKTASGKVQKHILRRWGAKWASQGIGKVIDAL